MSASILFRVATVCFLLWYKKYRDEAYELNSLLIESHDCTDVTNILPHSHLHRTRVAFVFITLKCKLRPLVFLACDAI